MEIITGYDGNIAVKRNIIPPYIIFVNIV